MESCVSLFKFISLRIFTVRILVHGVRRICWLQKGKIKKLILIYRILFKNIIFPLQGVMARVYETVTVLCLLGTLVLGMTYVLSALIDHKKSSLHTLLSKYKIF